MSKVVRKRQTWTSCSAKRGRTPRGWTSLWTTTLPATGLQPREVRPHIREHVPDADRVREVEGGKGEAEAAASIAGNVA